MEKNKIRFKISGIFGNETLFYDCGKVLLDCRDLFRILYVSYPLLLYVMITLGNL